MDIFDDVVCELGEGPLWHPERHQLFWFDILGKRLFVKGLEGETQSWHFNEYVSAAGWVDRDTLLMASASGLWHFDTHTGDRTRLVALEDDNPVNRSNDGRADPYGGFWIGTMGVKAEAYAGAIYRYYRGELRQLYDRITIPNAICFTPDGETAYFSDTVSRRVQRVALGPDGWPKGNPDVFLDLREDELNPDGAVVDLDGNFWNAQWGASRVACYGPSGTFLRAVDVPSPQASCPAFGGAQGRTLFVTTAAEGIDADGAGLTYTADLDVKGLQEHQVIL